MFEVIFFFSQFFKFTVPMNAMRLETTFQTEFTLPMEVLPLRIIMTVLITMTLESRFGGKHQII